MPDEVQTFLEFSRCFSFTGADAKLLTSSIVYVLMRGEQTLYVGMSDWGARRPFDPTHHTLRKMQPTDKLLIWPMRDAIRAREMELELIWRLKPTWNQRDTRHSQVLTRLKNNEHDWANDTLRPGNDTMSNTEVVDNVGSV